MRPPSVRKVFGGGDEVVLIIIHGTSSMGGALARFRGVFTKIAIELPIEEILK
jgi:hypothetical protein